jgi:hypothetical protein
MPSFTKRLQIEQYGEFDFVFTRIYTGKIERVTVRVFDGKSKVCQFTMQPVLHYWMIAEAYELPVWVGGIELKLEKIIKENIYYTV